MKRIYHFTAVIMLFLVISAAGKSLFAQTKLVVNSPDWQTEVVLEPGETLSFYLRHKAQILIHRAEIDLMLIEDRF